MSAARRMRRAAAKHEARRTFGREAGDYLVANPAALALLRRLHAEAGDEWVNERLPHEMGHLDDGRPYVQVTGTSGPITFVVASDGALFGWQEVGGSVEAVEFDGDGGVFVGRLPSQHPERN